MTDEPADGEPVLVGRGHELGVLWAALSRITVGGTWLRLRGQPGVGKSALCVAVARRAGQLGHEVLSCTGVEGGTTAAFDGLRQLLPPDVEIDGLPPAQRSALEVALDPTRPSYPEPFLVAMATLTLLADRAAERPVTVLADDTQWLDEESAAIVDFIGRRLTADAIVLVSAARPDPRDTTEPVTAQSLVVEPLDERDSRDVVRRLAQHIDDETFRHIFSVAEGNPLALTELVRSVRRGAPRATTSVKDPVSERITSSFAGSYADLPAPTRAALLVAAVDRTGLTEHVVAAVELLTGQPAGRDVFSAAEAEDLVQQRETRTVFRHPLVRSAILELAGDTPVRDAHAALAKVTALDAHNRLMHLAESIDGHDDQVAGDVEAAADEALARGDVRSSIALLGQAARLTSTSAQRGHRLLRSGQQAFEIGRAAVVDTVVEAAAREQLSRVDRIRASWLSEIFTGRQPGDVGRIRELTSYVRESLAEGDLPLAWNILMSTASRCYWSSPGADTRADVLNAAYAMPSAGLEHQLVFVLAGTDPIGTSARVLTELARLVDQDIRDGNILRMCAMAAVTVGGSLTARTFIDGAESSLRERGRLGLLPHLLITRTLADFLIGDFPRARSALEEGRYIADETRQPTWHNGARIAEARLYAVTGEGPRALALLDQIDVTSRQQGTQILLSRSLVIRGWALTAERRYADAYAVLCRVFEPDDPMYDLRGSFVAVMFLIEAAVNVDRHDEARTYLDELRAACGPMPPPDLLMLTAYAEATLAGDLEAEGAYAKAFAVVTEEWLWPRARLHLYFGVWLRRARRSAEAITHLRAALVTFDRIGARPWAGQARDELRAAGSRDPGPGHGRNLPLTPQEAEIVRLAGAGLTNREIAAALFVSPRTVAYHLHRIFPKLGVTSRQQLGERGDRRGVS